MIQNNCRIIGITGGISTGKSTVSNYLIDKGYIVIDADKIAREVVEIGKPAYKKIVEAFGEEILLEDNTLNRKKLGRLIFSTSSLRNMLNKIVHPYVFRTMKYYIDKNCKKNKIIFVDTPLLIEEIEQSAAYGINYDEIWLIYTDQQTQLKRLMGRDNITENEALSKINAQMKLEDKMKIATKIIDNSGDLQSLKKELNKILQQLD